MSKIQADCCFALLLPVKLHLTRWTPVGLQVQSPLSWITASSVYGALRGLETFGQLVDRIELPKGRSASFSFQAFSLHVLQPVDDLSAGGTADSVREPAGSGSSSSSTQATRRLTALEPELQLAGAVIAAQDVSSAAGMKMKQLRPPAVEVDVKHPGGIESLSVWNVS